MYLTASNMQWNNSHYVEFIQGHAGIITLSVGNSTNVVINIFLQLPAAPQETLLQCQQTLVQWS